MPKVYPSLGTYLPTLSKLRLLLLLMDRDRMNMTSHCLSSDWLTMTGKKTELWLGMRKLNPLSALHWCNNAQPLCLC